MSEKEWAREYTDEQYLTKNEVMQAMHTSLIEGFWKDIVAYRNQEAFHRAFTFRTIGNLSYFVTLTPTIQAKIAEAQSRLDRFLSVYKKLVNPAEKEKSERAILFASLKAISALENAQMSELSLKALLNGTYQESNPFHTPVIAYKEALLYCLHAKSPSSLHLNEDFLAELLAKNLQESELTSFYRTSDFDGYAQKAKYMYNPDYTYAPYDYVETLMDDFLSWVKSSEMMPFVKMVASLYYFDYVRPFMSKNDEVGILFAKAVYAQNPENGMDAFVYPVESILYKNNRFKTLALEAQRSGDLTYLVLYAISVMSPLLDSLQEEIKSIKIETYQGEFTTLEGPEKQAAAEQGLLKTGKQEQMSLFETSPKETKPTPVAPSPVLKPVTEAEPKVENKPIPEAQAAVETPLPSKEVVRPAPETPAPSPSPVIEENKPIEKPLTPEPSEEKAAAKPALKPEKVITYEEMAQTSSSERTLSLNENPLSEKEVREYVEYLLETNPNLNKNQASFLASHCTLGRYYTIQQFKKFTRCAYETARTSMDKLASEKYYSKLQVKNKFVYTPLKKGENK